MSTVFLLKGMRSGRHCCAKGLRTHPLIGTGSAHARLKMARTLRRLMVKLRAARVRVRRLELLLLLAEREETIRCQHTWVKHIPGGPRDMCAEGCASLLLGM